MSDGAIYASADLTLCTVPATVTTMGLGLRSLAAALILTLLPACSGKKTATTRFVIAHQATQPPSTDVRCVPTTGTLDDQTLQMGKIATLRLSVRTHVVAGDAGAFGCDIVLHVPSDV